MKKNYFFATNVLFLMIFSGCVTAPVAYDSKKLEGQWEAKAQIRDLEKSKTNNVSLEVMAERDRFLRIEVSGTLGVAVASFLMSGDQVAYAIHTQKKFISGPASEKALDPLLSVSVDPRWLYNVFFDEIIAEKNWTCQSNVNSVVEKCERLSDGMKIAWSERQGEHKRITISNDKFELQILVKGYQPKVQSSERAFSLDAPAGYKRYKLQ